MTLSRNQPAWWEPEDRPWKNEHPKRMAQAVTVVSVNEMQGTALVEYVDATRHTHRALAELKDLRARALPPR